MSQKWFAFLFLLSLLISTAQVSLASPDYLDHIYTMPAGEQGSSLIYQMAEQNFADPNVVLGSAFTQPVSSANGIEHFFGGYLQDIIAALSGVVKSFFLNPNLVQITANSNNQGDLSFLLKGLANIIYGIALDLLFLLFVLAIWQYWTKSSWQGNINAMSAVGRLICTIGIIVAWPTIYSFEIDLSNEMISAIFANGADQLHLFDMVMANMVNVGASSGLLGTLMISQPIAVGVAQLSGFLSAITLFILCILAIILIYELIYLIALKAMQMALMTAQYVFAPVFLIFFATPGTEKIATGYIRTFVETSMWSFIWIGLLKILIILMYASFNPWGKIITAIGILQLMMRVPQFLGRFKVSSASEFVNPAFFTEGLQKKAFTYAGQIAGYKNQFVSAFTGMFRDTGASAGQKSNGAGNNMSADFSFGDTPTSKSTNNSQPPTRTQAPIDSQMPAGTQLDQKNMDRDPSANRSTHNWTKKDVAQTNPFRNAHVGKRNFPGLKSPPAKRNIFARHYKVDADNKIPTRQLPDVVPVGAAALRGNSLPVSSISGFKNFKIGNFGFPGLASSFSKFDFSGVGKDWVIGKPKPLSKPLVAMRLAAARLVHKPGLESLLSSKQQFVLPSFVRQGQTPYDLSRQNSHQLPQDAGNSKKSKQFNNIQRDFSRGHTIAEDNAGNTYLSKHKTALYYSSPVYPRRQRHYANVATNNSPLKTMHSFSSDADTSFPSAHFRSYYS